VAANTTFFNLLIVLAAANVAANTIFFFYFLIVLAVANVPLILDTISGHIHVAANSIVLATTLGLVNKKLR